MKKIKILSLFSLLILSTGFLFAQNKSDQKALGTWAFSAQEAPYGYTNGDIVITKDGKELAGEIVFSEYYKIKVQNLKLENKVLTFKTNLEGESINVKVTITKDDMKGFVTFSEGTLPITAKRKKK